jgi:ribokinase
MSDASLQCDVDGENCRICFDYAEKIGVDKKTDVPAVGNAANHAIGVSRLGLEASIYTIVGDDVQGHIAKDVFKENGVDTSYVAFDTKHGTNFSTVINYKSERTIFVYHEPRDYSLPALAPAQWIYLTSVSGEGVVRLHEQVEMFITSNPKVKVAFNPGTYQIKQGREKLMPLLTKTSALFLNREEAMRVLQTKDRDIAGLIKPFHDLGITTMVLTDGTDGAYASDGKTVWHLAIYPGPVVERTGCGDAFGSGFLSAIVAGKDVPAAMQWGNANSTSVVQYIGAREGLLDREKLEKMIAENTAIAPTVFTTLS